MKTKEVMISQLTDYERDSKIINEIYRVLGDEADTFLDEIEDLYKQTNIDTATWGLDVWENNLGIVESEGLSYKQRRANIKGKIKRLGKIDVELMQEVLQSYYDNEVSVVFSGKLWFRIPIEGDSYLRHSVICDIIKTMKPAHLGYDIELYLYTEKVSAKINTITLTGEESTIYPYVIRKLDAGKTNIFVGIGQATGNETVTVQPGRG